MSRLFAEMQKWDTVTENGMPAHSTTGDALVDLFFSMGAARSVPADVLLGKFSASLAQDPLLTLKAAFFNRNIRGGQGERRSFRIFFRYLCRMYPDIAIKNLPNVPYFGRWDDVFVAFGTRVEKYALNMLSDALLRDRDALCAKWMPREGKSKDVFARKLRKHMGLSRKEYRKLLASLTDVVETKMCDNEWDSIEYSHVPSRAMKIYRNAFGRHSDKFGQWLDSLEQGESKVNAGAIYPHEIVSAIYKSPNDAIRMLEQQWKALPNYLTGKDNILPVCDVSASMKGEPMEVSIGLGLYLAERNKGLFHNKVITFSQRPSVFSLKSDTLFGRVMEMRRMDWGYNTNLEAVFNLILKTAVRAELSEEDMPSTVLILSDMQFDEAMEPEEGAIEMIRNKYWQHGYKMPDIVFWNLRDVDNVPVKFDEQGVALISGFSPSVMKAVLGGDFNPRSLVERALSDEVYERVLL